MHMLVLGGTGQNGQLIIANALARGHTVTALARNPDGVTPRPGLTVVKGKTPLTHNTACVFSSKTNLAI